MKLEGYKISGYDATYRKALFNVCERGNRVLEITDVESGTTFVVDFNGADRKRRTSGWQKNEAKGHGISVTFGSKGLFEQLKYSGRKPKKDV